MPDAAEEAAFERILEYLRQTRGFDFTAYKRSSLLRRMVKRMQTVEVSGFDTYLDYLQVHPDEFVELFNTILINVTSFFRDEDVWQTLAEEIVPAMAGGDASVPIRIWSAGCASGQEPYSIAMLFASVMGLGAFRDRVKVYATDVDDDALGEARQAVYTAKQVESVPAALREQYFDRRGDRFALNREVRRGVIFGHHDLIQDAPISRIDLLLCRNTLMYFHAEAQARIIQRLHFSLKAGGVLVLGRAEMLSRHSSLVDPIDLKRRIFRTIPVPRPRPRLPSPPLREEPVDASPSNSSRLRDAAFDSAADAQIMIDPAGVLVAVNAAARRFGVAEADVGSRLQNLEISYRPADLRTALDRIREDGHDITLRNVPWERAGATRFYDVTLSPMLDDHRAALGTRITFTDVTPLKRLQEELTSSKQELETAYEELQSTNEELETTNEELQSTVEELETTNEELQSTNEELETMNEELHSTNEELQTMNDELRTRSVELNVSNSYLESVLSSLRSAVIVIDRELCVDVWNTEASNLWGLREDEARGTSFFNLDIGLPVAELHQPIREVINGSSEMRDVTLSATNRKGKPLQCHVTVAALRSSDRNVTGAILLMQEAAAGNR